MKLHAILFLPGNTSAKARDGGLSRATSSRVLVSFSSASIWHGFVVLIFVVVVDRDAGCGD